MNVLTISNLTKEYETVTAVNGVSFDVEDGEFVSILGPSGSGKSTILRMVAGFESPTSGDISINDKPVTELAPFDRDVNMVFQSLALFPHLTCAENIEFGLKQKGVGKAERKERIEDILEMVELEGYGDRDPSELSGGEQQRIALARALVNEPEIVLFDEPLASLDRKLRQHMQTELQRIQNETDITFLYVTHDQEVALAVSDRMVLLNEGEIEQIGTTKEIYDEPTSEFAADFIGDVNGMPATVDDVGDGITVTVSNVTMKLPNVRYASSTPPQPGDAVRIGVRPEDVELSPGKGSNTSIEGEIISRVYAGNETIYTIGTEITEFTVKSTADYEVGSEVSLGLEGARIHVFDGGE